MFSAERSAALWALRHLRAQRRAERSVFITQKALTTLSHSSCVSWQISLRMRGFEFSGAAQAGKPGVAGHPPREAALRVMRLPDLRTIGELSAWVAEARAGGVGVR